MTGGWAAPHTERPKVRGEPLQSLALPSPTASAGLVPVACAGSGLCRGGLPAAGPCRRGLGPVSNGPLSVAAIPRV